MAVPTEECIRALDRTRSQLADPTRAPKRGERDATE
jgi:hypothetical protein